MNDERTGQLALNGWRIPIYLQSALWLVSEGDTVQTNGEVGLFELSIPARQLRLYLAGEEGTALAAFRWEPDSLGWTGGVHIGGTVDSITVLEHNDTPITIINLVGRPLEPNAAAYAQPVHRTQPGYVPPGFEEALVDTDEGYYTFLAPEGSGLSLLAENALMNRLRVWLRGRVASDAEGWHTLTALPLILEQGTLFGAL